MQDQYMSHATRVQTPLYSKPVAYPVARRIPSLRPSFRKPEPCGLTPAQLRDIVLEQLG